MDSLECGVSCMYFLPLQSHEAVFPAEDVRLTIAAAGLGASLSVCSIPLSEGISSLSQCAALCDFPPLTVAVYDALFVYLSLSLWKGSSNMNMLVF